MTCIVGLVDGGVVHFGADTGQFSGWDFSIKRDGKIYEKADALVGSSGLSRFGQLIRHHLDFPAREGDPMEWLVRLVVPGMRQLLKDHGHAKVEHGIEKHESSLLIGVAGRLFNVQADYCVCERSDAWDAIGCGSDFALGSLRTTATLGLDAPTRVRIALETAAHFSAAVRAPFTFLQL